MPTQKGTTPMAKSLTWKVALMESIAWAKACAPPSWSPLAKQRATMVIAPAPAPAVTPGLLRVETPTPDGAEPGATTAGGSSRAIGLPCDPGALAGPEEDGAGDVAALDQLGQCAFEADLALLHVVGAAGDPGRHVEGLL